MAGTRLDDLTHELSQPKHVSRPGPVPPVPHSSEGHRDSRPVMKKGSAAVLASSCSRHWRILGILSIALMLAACGAYPEQGGAGGVEPVKGLPNIALPAAYTGTGSLTTPASKSGIGCTVSGTATLKIAADGVTTLEVKIAGFPIVGIDGKCAQRADDATIDVATGDAHDALTRISMTACNTKLRAVGDINIVIPDKPTAHVVCFNPDSSIDYTLDADLVRDK